MVAPFSVRPASRTGRRVLRSPRHTHNLRFRPWVIQPFMIAPVLAGETLKNLLLQERTVTDPIKNPLIGWWLEHFYFYVQLSDLTSRDEFVGQAGMLLNPSWSNDNVDDTTADVPTYHAGGADGINWTSKCLEVVVEHYFRDENEAWNSPLLDTLPQAKVRAPGDNSWMDSLVNYEEIAGAEDESLTVGVDDVVTGREVEDLMRRWEAARWANLTEMTFEVYLRTFGVNTGRAEDPHRPELIRYMREWTYPTNHVNTSTGAPTSACSWSIQERADKARLFKEPGFIIGVVVARPKVYFKNQAGSAAWLMNKAERWLPALSAGDPWASLVNIPDTLGTNGPLSVNLTDAGGYWVDVKDLLLYGDQFVNFALTATDANIVALPTVAAAKDYVAEVDMEAMFVTADVDKVKADGITTLHIEGHQWDTTPQPSNG